LDKIFSGFPPRDRRPEHAGNLPRLSPWHFQGSPACGPTDHPWPLRRKARRPVRCHHFAPGISAKAAFSGWGIFIPPHHGTVGTTGITCQWSGDCDPLWDGCCRPFKVKGPPRFPFAMQGWVRFVNSAINKIVLPFPLDSAIRDIDSSRPAIHTPRGVITGPRCPRRKWRHGAAKLYLKGACRCAGQGQPGQAKTCFRSGT